MAKRQPHVIIIKNKQTGEVYWTRKNGKQVERKIELKKYSPLLRKHIVFKETKK
jgi:large subunit ribosomal protein L33